ncbi:MAG TPA: competence/damage-inducible protein A, partial [Firmicutes bacterium]|nr:competence/damage-inducible protein A [Bacillota bacterium]
MNAEVITAGTELLLGDVIDTNAPYLSGKLSQCGIDVYYRTTVGDNKERLVRALETAAGRSNLIIITGGLGPTVDDITRYAVSEFAKKNLVRNEKSLLKIRGFFDVRGIKMPESNIIQSMFPEGSLILENRNGTAPGFITEGKGVIIAALPGVPWEMEEMFQNALMPVLEKKGIAGRGALVSRTVEIAGVSESLVNDRIKDLFEKSINPSIAVLAAPEKITIRATAKAETVKKAADMADELITRLAAMFPDNIYGINGEKPQQALGRIFTNKNMTISTAESCTAGMIAAALTEIPGSTAYYMGGINSYSNESKTDILGVKSEVIEKYGAVSGQCAEEMAESCARLFKTDAAVSVTGIAGPGGGSREKPVGLVFMGFYVNGKTDVMKFNFPGSRDI